MNRRDDLEKFYRLLAELRQRVGGHRLLRDCHGKNSWPERGVYFFFEDGEFRDDGVTPRVVRVGTHAVSEGSKATLWNRLRGHRGSQSGGGNHRGSIFRLRVGQALMQKEDFAQEIHKSWGLGGTALKQVRTAEAPLEFAVSGYIGRMPFLWVAVDDAAGAQSLRSYIEKNSIGLLSNFRNPSLDFPSAGWLGRLSTEEKIRRSGLWNSDFVDRDYDPAFLAILMKFVEG